ncbi:hypothetical protein ASC87_27710 [Rhizobacter sp. Root1221]|nr:hypothetical protein ASC87_27710 [Rhizobacter sp. Root1221]
MLEELDAASDDIQASTSEVRGTVCVTASVALGQTVVMPLVKVLHQQHPGIELDLRFSDSVVATERTLRRCTRFPSMPCLRRGSEPSPSQGSKVRDR